LHAAAADTQAGGARAVIAAHAASCLYLPIDDDPGVLIDVDTPADYDMIKAGGPGDS
jgi:CTP:molybdopterin cytidylyltransferase MocA